MASWKAVFANGVAAYREERWGDALQHFSSAIKLGGPPATVYDSRAAAYEKLGKTKEALLDSKAVIKADPQRWQGYARSARLFFGINKFTPAITMVNMALERLQDSDTKRRAELASLKEKATAQLAAVSERERSQASRSFYHFGKLPVEIATTIFSSAVEQDHANVVLLAQVCRNWRSIILNTPSLWSTLCLSSRRPREKAKLWMSRSRGRFVNLTIRPGYHTDRVTTAMDELNAVSLESLRQLFLDDIDPRLLPRHLPGFTTQVVRALEALTITTPEGFSGVPWLFACPDMQLRNLLVTGVPLDWSVLAAHCSHLRHITYHGTPPQPNIAGLSWILLSNSNLESFEIILPARLPVNTTSEERELPNLITMPRLTHLCLSGPMQLLEAPLHPLSLPSLQVLSLVGFLYPINHYLTSLSSKGFTQGLTTLKIRSCFFSAATMVCVLRRTPLLQHLALMEFGGKDINEVVQALGDRVDLPEPTQASSDHEERIRFSTLSCPLLSDIDFSRCSQLRGGPLIRLIKTHLGTDIQAGEGMNRVPHASPIHSLRIDGCPGIDADALPWIRERVPVFSCVYMTKKEAKRKR